MFCKNQKGHVSYLIIGALVAFVLAIFSVSMVLVTNKPKFCASCHEMQPFVDTWNRGIHGMADRGIMKAKCVDCHLPHDSLPRYLIAKVAYGLNDF